MLLAGLSHQSILDNVDGLVANSWMHLAALRPSLASKLLTAGKQIHAKNGGLLVAFVAAQAWSGMLPEAEETAREILVEFPVYYDPVNIIATYYLGSLVANRRQFDEANELFSRYSHPLSWAAGGTMRSIRFGLNISNQPAPFTRTVGTFISRDTTEADLVYVVCCDERYLMLFAEAVHRSVSQNMSRKCIFHLHVVNPGQKSFDLIKRLSEKEGAPVAATYETTDLSHLTFNKRKVYYSCARFFILDELLDRYGRPMIVADADQLVVKDPSDLFDESADIRLTRSISYACNLMSKFSASAVVVRNTEGARRYLEYVSSYLAERMTDPRAIAWHLDQIALGVADVMLSGTSIKDLPSTAMHSGGPDDPVPPETIFWSVTYSIAANAKKIESQSFLKYAA